MSQATQDKNKALVLEETITALATDADEVLVEMARPLRNNPGPHEAAFVK